MMKINFDIHIFPGDLTRSYALDAYTEGVLNLEVDGVTLFKEPGILIVEFYLAMKSWLNNYNGSTESEVFIYESMDFEESPILAFKHKPELGGFEFDSVWKENDAIVSMADIQEAFQGFTWQLKKEIFERSGYILE